MKIGKNGKRIAIIAAGASAVAAAAAAVMTLLSAGSPDAGRTGGARLYTYSFPAMSTMCAVELRCENSSAAEKARRAIQENFRIISACADIFDPDSETARINASGHAGAVFELSEPLVRLFQISRRAWEYSGGVFDPSLGPVLEARRRPEATEDEMRRAAEATGFDRVASLDGNHLTLLADGVKFDFGGVAKGLAVDMAAEACADIGGVRGGIINLGGNIRLLPGSEPAEIAFVDPDAPGENGGSFLLRGGEACASSGSYRRGGHIVDPRSGAAPEHVAGVTVKAGSAAEADWLSTALFIDAGLRPPPGCGFIIPTADGKFTTRGDVEGFRSFR